ncbi:SSI family serine proteinase inhibitor [uncultured Streptomyces sp.]|uniref:SSI family serine proteinase inhibitor n=1 Tax=uncultured Streptomyces sp. TaxID=174707 RepID=UPI00261879D0|nr:SSI family serine proteinase inhibitor [uncultured Streptomyces sp.]
MKKISAALTALLLGAGPGVAAHAAEAPAAAPRHAVTTLVLAVHPDGEPARHATLRCDPAPAGSHPDAPAACERLTAADGRPDALRADPRTVCTFEFRPVRLVATGTWAGRTVRYDREFANPCQAAAATGPLFAF